MRTQLFTRTLAASLLAFAAVAVPVFGQNGKSTLPARSVKRVGGAAQTAPPMGPVVDNHQAKATGKRFELTPTSSKRVGSSEAAAPAEPTLKEKIARQADYEQMSKTFQPRVENHGEERVLPKDLNKKPEKQIDLSSALSNLPKTYGGPESAPKGFVRPQIDERAMAPAIHPIVDDYSQIFITTADKPTQAQAERLAALYLGRAAQPAELVLCVPSEGFILKLSGALAADAALRDKAKDRVLKEADVVTVTPSVTEGPERYYMPGHVLANCRPDMDLASVRKVLLTHGGQVLEEHDQKTIRVFVIQVPKGADPRNFATELKKAGLASEVVPNVQATLHNDVVSEGEFPNDPLYSTQWWLNQANDHDIDAPRGWAMYNQQLYDTWVSIAVVDGNGFEVTHPDLAYYWNAYDAVNDDSDPSPENADDNHGTPCAGLVSANSDNGLGVASVNWSYGYVVPIKIGFNIVGGSFSTNSTTISRAATKVVAVNRVVASSHSYSGSGSFYSSTVLTYYQNMYNNPRGGKGAVLCASAGNNNLADEANYPASYTFAITVAASDQNDARASFSNYGNYIEVTAPGVSTRTIDRTGANGYDASDYTYFAGTSAACPIAAGLCGAIARQKSSMGRDSIAWILQSTCEKVTYNYNLNSTYGSKSFEFGYGRINMGNAIGLANGQDRAVNTIQGDLTCGSFVSGSTIGYTNNSNYYYGVSWYEPGPDANWTLTVPQRALYTISLSNHPDGDLDLFLLEDDWAGSTIAFGNETITEVLDPGVYNIVIDGYSDPNVASTYDLSVTCQCIPIYSNNSCSSGDFIKSVRINSSSFDSSGCAPANYIAPTANYQQRSYWTVYNNNSNFMEVHMGTFSQNLMVLIDFDNNGSFGTDELVYVNNSSATTFAFNFNAARANFPAGQLRRMRIISSYNDFTAPYTGCLIQPWGETEDHWVYCSPQGFPITFGSTSDDYVRGVVRDPQGFVYVSFSFRGTINFLGTSLTSTSTTKRDMGLAKVSDAGVLQWVKTVGNGSFDMEPQGVNVDGQGFPVWAGSFAGTANFAGTTVSALGSYDAFTARFERSNGNLKWVRRVGGSGNDYLYGSFVSNSGNVYSGGSFTGAITFPTTGGTVNLTNAGGLDGFIVKWDSVGNGIWASRMGSTANDEVKSIEYNGGDLVACGYMGNNCTFPGASAAITLPSVGSSRDGFAGRINSTGKFVWVKNFGSIFNDEARSIVVDPSTGNVFVAAQVADAPVNFNGVNYSGFGNNDIMVMGWNFYTQAPVWAKRVGSSTGDSPNSIRWDGNRLVVAGYVGGAFNPGIGTLTPAGGQDAVLLRYDKTTGAVSSALLIGGTGNDQALTMYCNPGNREEFVGGVMSNTVNFYTNVPRVSAGAFDGFLSRHFPPSGARMGEEEVSAAASADGSLKVYPVPAGRELRIAADGGQPTVVDMKGTRQPIAFHMEGSEMVLDVSGLKPGLYVLQINGRTARFIKE